MTSTIENAERKPILGCIADDVTGATDLAINLVQGGMRVIQLLGVPDRKSLEQTDGFDAIVVALKSRSIPAGEAMQQSLDSVRVLRELGDLRIYFKYCSTFDSTEKGNIGPVAEALLDHLSAKQTVFCPAFPRAGRTVYQGHLFVGDSLLHESGMENHPLNPMTDANLVRFLGKQTKRSVGLITNDAYDRLQDDLSESPFLIADACDDSDLLSLAKAVANMPLVTGGSGLARYLPAAYREAGRLKSSSYEPTMPQVPGRGLVMAGSCSTATRAQVKRFASDSPGWQVQVESVLKNPEAELERLVAWASEVDTDKPLFVHSSAAPDQVSQIQEQFGAEATSLAIEKFMARVARTFVDEFAVTRLVLAGGETSGAIVRELGVRALAIGPEICAGVPWTESLDETRPLALALKSGNFGDEDFFGSALGMLP